MIFGFAVDATIASDPAKIVGPNSCAECHKQEAEAWQASHHFKTFREMPRRKEANEIAEKMGVQRIRSESMCLTCHYTIQEKESKKQPIAGISCESCHGAGEDWIKVHSGYSGKTEKTEEDRKQEAFDLLLDTIDALAEERDQDEKIWGSMVKQALKRRKPGFNESYYGFRTFSDLLEEAQTRKLLSLEPDQKSGGYVIRRL